MYTEILKIIEGGLIGDREKVYNYAKTLSENLINSGDKELGNKIYKTLNNKNGLFPISRIEENQRLAYERVRICRNPQTIFALAILWNNDLYIVDFDDIDFDKKSIDLKKHGPYKERFYDEDFNR